MESKTSPVNKNYLFVIYNHLKKNSQDYFSCHRRTSKNKIVIDKYLYGKKRFGWSSCYKLNTEEKFFEYSYLGEESNYHKYYYNLYITSLGSGGKSNNLEPVVFLIKFNNSDYKKINLASSLGIFHGKIEKIIKDELKAIAPTSLSQFSIYNCSLIYYLETPNEIYNQEDGINYENLINFRKQAFTNNIKVNPFLYGDCIIDDFYFFTRKEEFELNNYIIYNTFQLNETEKNRMAISYCAEDFINFMIRLNSLKRFEKEIKKSSIYKLNTSDYIEKAEEVKKKDLSKYFKNVFLKEKQHCTSLIIEYELDSELTIREIKSKYEEFINIEKGNTLEIYKYHKSTNNEICRDYNDVVYSFWQTINVLKNKEKVLNETFRDLTTLTTNDLNFILQKKMEYLTYFVIFITLISLIVSLYNDELKLFIEEGIHNIHNWINRFAN